MNSHHTEQSHVYYYSPLLINEPLPEHVNDVKKQTLVLFGADNQYAQNLKDTGYHVINVRVGHQFQVHSSNNYEVSQNGADDYHQLVASWKKEGICPDKIIQISDRQSEKSHDVYITFFLVKALLFHGMEALDWLYVYENHGDTCKQEAMAGFFHSLHAEKPQVKAKIIAVDKKLDLIIDTIMAEASVQEEDVIEVSYQDQVRQVRRIQQWENLKNQGTKPSIWRTNGVYILTGGAGGLGLLMAEHIVNQTQANIILVGRSALSKGKEGKLEELSRFGSNVVYYQADITKEEDSNELIDDIKSRYGRIHGVIHMAGCLRDGFLQSKNQQAFTDVLTAKIDGTKRLDEALKSEKLEMFVLFSSLISLIGNAGQVDYAYANRYLDAFATKRTKQVKAGERHGVTVSVNWPLWQDGGMTVDKRTQEWMKKVMGLDPLSISDGTAGFETAVKSGLTQLVILSGSRENILSRKAGKHVTKENDSTQGASNQELQLKTEEYLKQILADEIKVPVSKIKSHSALEDYGIDSVLLVALTRQLEQDFGGISKTLFFEYQTIAELANYFVTTYKEELLKILKVTKLESRRSQNIDQFITTPTGKNKNSRLTTSRSRRNRSKKRRERSRTTQVDTYEPIAIVGLSGRYPQANDLTEFWENLKQGKDCIREVPMERWNWRDGFDPDKNKKGSIYTKWGGFMDDVDCFDPLFFNISPKEAELMDPQERLFLETAWHTLEDAGYTRYSLGTDKVGVFVGVMYGQYQMLGVEEGLKGNQVAPSSSYASIANRVSYYMNFHGPSMALDTMCSSSLTAIHLACDSIRKGESDVALAGGVNVSIHPSKYLFLSQGKFASTDGRCRSFGEGGDGYVPGEGVGAVLLKPLGKAQEDGDYIYGVIKGSSLNHGGKTNGYTVPNPQMQAELIKQALNQAEVNPREVSYIEAHGTGTALGDPIEITGLVKAFGNNNHEQNQCAIGSIKSNIGHLESAAGIAGLTKILLQMKHKKLVPSLHAETLNPNIDFASTPFYVQRDLRDWKEPVSLEKDIEKKLPRIAGISSFGAGGANAHLIIQEWVNTNTEPVPSSKQLIVLSALNQERLRNYANRLVEYLNREKRELVLSDVAYTLQAGREGLAERLALVVSDFDELIAKLTLYVKGASAIDGMYFGNQKQSELDHILEGETGLQFMETVIQRGDWTKLAQFWQAGVDQIPWKKLHDPRQPKRVPLPVYPFARERYWIATSGDKHSIKNEVVKGLHPLLQQNTSTFEEQRFTLTLSGQEFYLADHHVHNNQVLPGVVYIEMARAAGELSYNKPVKQIKNVIWESPIVVQQDQEAQPVSISLYPQQAYAAFEVWTEEHRGERTIHAHGEVHYEENNKGADTIELETIRSRCQTEWQREACYQRFKLNGFDYGESFQSLINLRFSNGEALSEIALSDKVQNGAKSYMLHPSLLDGAFQSILGLLEEKGNKTYLPYGMESVVIYDSIQDARYVHVIEEKGKNINDHEREFKIVITDQVGRVLVIIENFIIRQSLSFHRKSETQVGTFYLSWEEQPQVSSPGIQLKGDILLFAPDERIFQKLKSKLEKEAFEARVRLVQPGNAFDVQGDEIYYVNPSSKKDYLNLFNHLITNGFKPNNIIHVWSQAKDDYSKEGIKARLDYSVYSLLYIAQAIMTHKLKQTVDITYIYYEQEGQSLYAANSGWLKTLAEENPMFRCKSVATDIDPNHKIDHWLEETCIDQTIAEVRLTEGKRWVKRIQKTISNQGVSPAANDRLPIKQNRTYLITGGTGGLGIIFAKYLAEKTNGKVRLILTGRSPLTAEKRSQLHEVEQHGADVEYRQADISNREDVLELISDIKERHGGINGIIHSAGVLRDGFVLKKTAADMDAVLGPKVYGTIWLDEATSHEALDFFVLFSSLSSERGNPGQSDYAYANAFLDALAHQHKREDRPTHTISINWPLWREGRMLVNPEVLHLLEKRMPGIVPLSTPNGLAVFEKGLRSSESQFLVVEGYVSALDNLFTASKQELETDISVKPALDHDQYKKPLENYLKKILSEETKLAVSQISATEELEDYGIDSVMVMNMTRVLERDFGELSKTLFFEYQTIQELHDYFMTSHQSKVQELFSHSVSGKPSTTNTFETSSTRQYKNKEVNRSRFIGEHGKQNQSGHEYSKEEIAIVGLSGRYPMAENLDQLWENLKAGKDCISEVPADRWDHTNFFDSDKQKKGKTYSKWGGFMDDVDKFDPLVFNISPREAKQMDPQERLFLQTVWHTMEDAGYTKKQLNKYRVGVFVGAMYAHYQMFGANQDMTGQDIPASSFASIANRVSYFFNFHGPSIALDTMCSSSLTAIHLACKSIQLGESEVAFAGGVNVSIHPHKYLLLGQGKFVSTDGKCRSFGEGGDGYVPGEGVGAVLLKPLSKAIQDGDQIYGVIKSSTVNHDGKTNGYSVPNPNAQAGLLAQAFKEASIDPRHLSYIETHGTGTALGDPIEITGLQKALEPYNKDTESCSIGSVKSNIGHLESAAGIAGLTKLLLQLKHKQLVPSIHTDVLNPNINFAASPFYVQRELSDWKAEDYPRLAGLSSFGAGGSNAHLIVEEWTETQANHRSNESNAVHPQLIVLSAKNKKSLKRYAQKLVDFLNKQNRLKNVDFPLPQTFIHDIRQAVARVINVDVQEIAFDEELTEYGFDQAMIAQLAQALSQLLQIEVQPYVIYENNSLKELVQGLSEINKQVLVNQYDQTINIEHSKNEPLLMDIVHTLQVGREAMEERLAFIVNSTDELREKLEKYVNDQKSPEFLQGTVKKGEERIQLFYEDEDSQELIKTWVHKGKLEKLALLWVNGVDIDWTQMNASNGARRISLPGYPFARERYWVEMIEGTRENNGTHAISHPLIDQLDRKLSLGENGLVFIKKLSPQSQVVHDHQVKEKAMLPGAAYLEMVLAACQEIDPNQSYELHEVIWKKPIIIQFEPLEIRLILREFEHSWHFDIQSNHNEQFVTHATGKVIVMDSNQEKDLFNHIVPSEVKITSTHQYERKEIYERFGAINLQYGPYFQVIKKLWGNDREALGQLELPENVQLEQHAFILPPNLLDGALQTISGIKRPDNSKKDTLVPFAVEKLVYLNTLPSVVYAYVEQKQAMLFDIALVDEYGKVFAKLVGVEVRVLPDEHNSVPTADISLVPFKGEETELAKSEEVKEGSIDSSDLVLKVEQTITNALVAVLQIDLQEFDDHAAFTDFGVDSVLAVEIINRINIDLAISLRTTDLFNYVSIRALADYIIEEFVDELTSVQLQILSNTESKVIQQEDADLHIEGEQYAEQLTTINQNKQAEYPNSKLSENNQSSALDEIAIVGMSGQFPGAKNLNEFWENLVNGKNTVNQVERWEDADFYSPDRRQADKSYSKWMGQLVDIDEFDPLFFNISPKEAEMIDPQQRLFLMEAWRALEDAGYSQQALQNQKCGVFVGCGSGDYMDMMKEHDIPPSAYQFMGNDESILPARISYFLNLKGPSLAINTACSSSLVAVHLACESIRAGTSDMALAGGISILNTPRVHVLASRAGMLSPEGQCKAFDNSANGFVPSEGVGVVVLKPIKKAIADGDHIYGVIKGSGINQDGKTNGITAPSAPSQTALELEVYKKYQINPADISYVEAHGTGTKLGDPIEIDALTNAFKAYTQKNQYCAIGSVKSNIGHALPAAGIAGLLKILLSLKNKQIAPTLLIEKENEHIAFEKTPFYVNETLKKWQNENGKRRMSAISSFGFSGTNAHMVIEEAPPVKSGKAKPNHGYLITLSAKTESALQSKIRELHEFLKREENDDLVIQDLAYTLHIGRSHFVVRAVFVTSTLWELKAQLSAVLSNGTCNDFRQHNLEQNPVHHHKDRKQQGEELLVQLVKQPLQQSDARAKLFLLADFYIQGYNLAWETLYAGGEYQRLSLPTYPFDLQRCWIPNAPLIHQNGQEIESNIVTTIHHSPHVVLHQTVSENDPIVRDHQVADEKLYPGVGFLQLAYEGIQRAGFYKGVTLSNVLWLKPLSVKEKPVELEVSVHSDNERNYYEVKSKGNDESIVHARGEFIPLNKAEQSKLHQLLPVTEIKQRCRLTFSKKDLYEQLTSIGMHYGPYFQAVEAVWSNDKEALGYLQLAPAYVHELNDKLLHPSLVDAAMHTISGLLESDQLLLPFGVDQIDFYRKLDSQSYAYVTNVGNYRYDVSLTDLNGKVCIKLHGVTLVPTKKKTSIQQDFYYQPSWIENPQKGSENPVNKKDEHVLLIHPAETAGLHSALVEEHPNAQVYRIQFGEQTQKLSPNVWEVDPSDDRGIGRILSEWEKIDLIYFMGGVQVNESVEDLHVLEKSQQTGILSLFRLVKELNRHPSGMHSLTLKVITNDIFPVYVEDEVRPESASVHGFTKSLAKEYPSWNTKLIDFSLRDIMPDEANALSKLAGAVATESADTEEKEVAIRRRRRYVQALESVQLPPANSSPFKQNGCYLILGGAGGIGMELSRYISEQVQANLVLIGRSPLDKEREEKLNQIRENGSEVLYLQADALNLESMQQAINKAKEKFGVINGAIHSAIVLRDKIIANMTEDDLRVALDTKVQGSYILHLVLKNEPLDFMLFFSSVQSFSGNPGQSNYAAGCTFKDAFAQALMKKESYPVRIINWGYWGTVGIVSSGDYNKRLAQQGVQSILPEEGMEAIVRVLSNRLQQVIPFKADKRVLEKLGIDTKSTVILLPEQPSHLKRGVKLTEIPKMAPGHAYHIKQAFKQLAAFGGLLLLNTFKQLGAWAQMGEQDTIDGLQKRLGIVPKYRRLLSAGIDMLERLGFVEKSANDLISSSKITAPDIIEALGQLERRKQELAATYPEIQAHLNLLWTCYTRYPDILTGRVPATDIMFPNTSMELVENIYRNNKMADYYNQLVVKSIQTYLQQTLKELNSKQKVKILEIGAGTGGTSTHVFEGIRSYGNHLEYVYSDISFGFTQYGKRRFGLDNPFVEFKVLDIEKDVIEQGFTLGEYDIILATNVLHATSNLSTTLHHIKSLLKTNGWLIVNETTQVHDFATLTFGLLDGWWLYEDSQNRLPNSPLIHPSIWERLCKEIGYEQFQVLGEVGLGQNVMITKSNGLIRQKINEIRMIEDSSQQVAVASDQVEELNLLASKLVNDKKKENDRFERALYIDQIIRASMEEKLGISASDIQLDKDFSDYGIDSISGVDLINHLNDQLGIVMRTTVLFDYKTVHELVEYICEQYSDLLKEQNQTITGVSSYTDFHDQEDEVDRIDENQIHHYIIEKVVESLEEILGVNGETIQLEKPFSAFGIDSISGVNVINTLNDKLGIMLRTTVLFDYSNVKELSSYIKKKHGREINKELPIALSETADVSDSVTSNNENLLRKLAKGELSTNEVINLWR
ncbi:SDR family NAD(P)-dependent oxidoreductase [Bacillus atrophaeus]|uniref:SDR family NAD(P)-dependent oxidoreductase n=1 Tax=Bacillus atrophaeus TaxID=1452 RepID=UPI0022817D30|nr:SDR family NAD(P)-dependent oxidoreductase [Bacillus atrophaeus]MCY9109397.1 SDR family NAD(P)-dependent oxidoreductase [Bacillus atrophaeus]